MMDPARSADRAGLTYVNDDMPGIRRRRCGRGFGYLDPDGAYIKDEEVKARIDALAIPPAYTDVWICPDPDGHLQATGRDEAGRKQYLYHEDWERVRQATKFGRLKDFGAALPALRERIANDLRHRALRREKVLAAAVRLMDRTLIRVGNEAYVRSNDSYGLTTLEAEHVEVNGRRIQLDFYGKSGLAHSIQLEDPRLARIVRACSELPGQRLFQYVDAEGARHPIGSSDVNAYLREAMAEEFSAKDFRTWGGTVTACRVLGEIEPEDGEAAVTQQLTAAADQVAGRLGNTRQVCRSYYIHPAVLEAFPDGTLREAWQRFIDEEPTPGLSPDEHATLRFLEKCG